MLLPESAVRPVWPYGAICPVAVSRLASDAARFRCQVCTVLVSARTGTAYAGIRTDATTYLRGATALAEGMSIRATGRLLSVDKDTVNHWLPVLGAHGQHVTRYFFRHLHVREC